MGTVKLGLNLEFARLENQGFDWAMDRAAEIGYQYIEPMVHWGRELLSAAGYFHSRSMLDDPLILKKAADDRGLRISSLSSHAPLAKPDVAVDYLRQSIRYAVEVGAPMIMVDDGPTPTWTTEDENYTLMRYTLQEAALVAEPRGIKIAIETHGPYTATPERLQNHETGRQSGADHQPRHRKQLSQRKRSARVARANCRAGVPYARQRHQC